MALNRISDPRWGRLVAAVRTIGSNAARVELSQKMGRTMLGLIREEIANQHDPYGNQWPSRTDGRPALLGLNGSFTASFTSDGPRVGTNKWYAKVHQRGWKINVKEALWLRFRLPGGQWASAKTVTIPRRQLFPEKRTGGLGDTWADALTKTFNEFMREYLRSR